jgi:hypothetical protein
LEARVARLNASNPPKTNIRLLIAAAWASTTAAGALVIAVQPVGERGTISIADSSAFS